ncbi:MAG TPA: ATP-binding protein, partial [Clostridia bacterium]|nr:ATP-binding protein [Clostridia bacterium]
VKHVLTFARGIEGEHICVRPRHLLHEMRRLVQQTFPKNITLSFSAPADLWNVDGDPTQLHQVVMNLCVNARDAMPEGGRLLISAENVTVDRDKAGLFADGKAGPHLLLRVSDTGHGIPAAILEKVFDPFFTTKALGQGTGLGLSTVLGIVRSHGGFLDVQTAPGQGTSFDVYLPAQSQVAEATAEPPTPAACFGMGECVLVVDDEDHIRTITQCTLATHGYEVLLAADGKEALQLLAANRHRLKAVITDIMMPGMDGVSLVYALREQHPRLPVIASTGWGQDGVRARLKALGVKSILQKPYASETLLNTLRDNLNLECTSV